MGVALKALVAQLVGTLAILAWIVLQPSSLDSPLALALGQAALAACTSFLLRAEKWWIVIHIAFMPAVVGLRRLNLPPTVYLGGFVLLMLVYWSTFRSRVPLYLSNRLTAAAVLAQLPQTGGLRVIDVGAGTGVALQRLAQARPDATFTGIEHAPLPFLLAWLTTRNLPQCHVKFGDFWRLSLAEYDVVYAFLSPVPMPRLWQKARQEMRAGSLLISNSFPVPGVQPQRVIEVADRRGTRLYCYTL